MDDSKRKLNPLQITIYVLFIIVLFIFELSNIQISDNVLVSMMISNSIFRIIGGCIFISFMVTYGYGRLYKCPVSIRVLLIALPALIISLNNFPIIAFLDDRAYLIQQPYTVFVFFFESLSNAFFEEVLFRSMILIFLLERFSSTKNGIFKAIIISSALFSILHLLNLFSGTSLIDVTLQLGYSFLMGMLWAVMYLKTKNIWITIILHSTYNFFGQVMFSLGIVKGRYDTVTIIITVVLALGATVYGYKIFQSLSMNVVEFTEDQ